MAMGSVSGPKTLRKGLTVLSLLKEVAPEGLGATEVARRTGVDRVAVQRIFVALETEGWARRDATGKRYFQDCDGSVVRVLGAMPQGPSQELVLAAVPAMRRLARQLGDAVFLVAREGMESVGIHREIGSYPIQILASYAGKRHPLGVGSAGMALLAALPDAQARAVVDANAFRYEEYGGITVEMIHRLRLNTIQRGYSIMQNYAVNGALGVGCAMVRDDGSPVLAISVSAVTERMPIKRQAEVARLIQRELEALRSVLPHAF